METNLGMVPAVSTQPVHLVGNRNKNPARRQFLNENAMRVPYTTARRFFRPSTATSVEAVTLVVQARPGERAVNLSDDPAARSSLQARLGLFAARVSWSLCLKMIGGNGSLCVVFRTKMTPV
jgi:hypothetical protein